MSKIFFSLRSAWDQFLELFKDTPELPPVKETEPKPVVIDPVQTGSSIPERTDNLPLPTPSVKKEKLLWYPHRIQVAYAQKLTMRTIGKYPYGYPQGAVVHFTAGRTKGTSKYSDADITKIFIENSCNEKKFCYFIIDPKGNIYQQFPLNEWGYHAGESSWQGLKGTVSNELVGIEVMCAGKVEKEGSQFKSWFGETYSEKEVRYSDKNKNIEKGYYHKYTAEQEKGLIKLLQWLKENGQGIFEYKYVLGHDEVAPTRKNDPGASLSTTMSEFRVKLENIK
jgi:hypothetical protein